MTASSAGPPAARTGKVATNYGKNLGLHHVTAIAADGPADPLGETLSQPPELESRRAEIEAALPPLE